MVEEREKKKERDEERHRNKMVIPDLVIPVLVGLTVDNNEGVWFEYQRELY